MECEGNRLSRLFKRDKYVVEVCTTVAAPCVHAFMEWWLLASPGYLSLRCSLFPTCRSAYFGTSVELCFSPLSLKVVLVGGSLCVLLLSFSELSAWLVTCSEHRKTKLILLCTARPERKNIPISLQNEKFTFSQLQGRRFPDKVNWVSVSLDIQSGLNVALIFPSSCFW